MLHSTDHCPFYDSRDQPIAFVCKINEPVNDADNMLINDIDLPSKLAAVETSDNLSITSSQDVTDEAIAFYYQVSELFDPMIATLDELIHYLIWHDYLVNDRLGDYSPEIKAIQTVLFFTPAASWGPFWLNTFAEAQSIFQPYDFFHEIEKLSGYTITKEYFEKVILKCYHHNDRWRNRAEPT